MIVPDFRGFGWSEHPSDEDFRKQTLADDLVALCAELGYERIAYVGHDWGCWVGWLLCLGQPQLIERALLISVSPPFPPEGPPTPGDLVRLSKLWYQLVLGSPLPALGKVPFIRQVLLQGRQDAWGPGGARSLPRAAAPAGPAPRDDAAVPPVRDREVAGVLGGASTGAADDARPLPHRPGGPAL